MWSLQKVVRSIECRSFELEEFQGPMVWMYHFYGVTAATNKVSRYKGDEFTKYDDALNDVSTDEFRTSFRTSELGDSCSQGLLCHGYSPASYLGITLRDIQRNSHSLDDSNDDDDGSNENLPWSQQTTPLTIITIMLPDPQ
jgi:hypothetical protein